MENTSTGEHVDLASKNIESEVNTAVIGQLHASIVRKPHHALSLNGATYSRCKGCIIFFLLPKLLNSGVNLLEQATTRFSRSARTAH